MSDTTSISRNNSKTAPGKAFRKSQRVPGASCSAQSTPFGRELLNRNTLLTTSWESFEMYELADKDAATVSDVGAPATALFGPIAGLFGRGKAKSRPTGFTQQPPRRDFALTDNVRARQRRRSQRDDLSLTVVVEFNRLILLT